MPNHSLRSFSSKLFLCCLGLFAANRSFGGPVNFNIPAQPAPAALQAFAKQAGLEVLFPFDELKKVQSKEVKGEMEPAEALKTLLDGTGYEATRTAAKNFVVRKTDAIVTTGSVRGTLVGAGGGGMPDVSVAIRGTAEGALTNKYGEYVFPKMAAGTYVLVATAPGYQPMHITDVVVRVGRELTLGKEEMRRATGDVLALNPFVVHAEAVTELEKFEVTGMKQKPFEGANIDIPRTIDDVQPYYIFDAKSIDQSGAPNLEDFLKRRLTMNATGSTNFQDGGDSVLGTTSTVNLRGLGVDKTLILINGRRMPGMGANGADRQPDLNGIPMGAIERIEVLPSSASGIYGGSAIGGVINVILKRNYTGGEIRATYDNTFDTDSAKRTVGATYGFGLEGGRTRVMLSASWHDGNSLLTQDRIDIYRKNLATIYGNLPAQVITSIFFQGSLPDISPQSTTQTTLALKNGAVINSAITHIATGTAPDTPAAQLYATLLANGGTFDFEPPPSAQNYDGRLRPIGTEPELKSFRASVRRQMLPNLEAFAEFSYDGNHSHTVNGPGSTFYRLTVPVAATTNPFTTAVIVRVPTPSTIDLPKTTNSLTRSFTFGLTGKLPWDWTGESDFTWSDNRSNRYGYYSADSTALNAAILSGAINPFVDTVRYPLALEKYLSRSISTVATTVTRDFAVRASGPLPALPWGAPSLTLGVEHLAQPASAISSAVIQPVTTAFNSYTYIYPRLATSDSGYGELHVPVLARDRLPLVHELELQLSGRREAYAVDTGTASYSILGTANPTYSGVTRGGQPVFDRTTFRSNSATVGLKYQPVADVTLRASQATAFLPPTRAQLSAANDPSTTLTSVIDPKNGQSVGVATVSGGNPAVSPQTSRSQDLGVIWEPRWPALRGLRLNAEHYHIEQFNFIGTLTAQQIVNLESLYPSRVTRNAAGAITSVDITNLNLYRRETEGWDLSADYSLKTDLGTLSLNASETIIAHLKNQYASDKPSYDAAGYSVDSEGGAVKHKAAGTLAWDYKHWNAGWSVQYIGSWKVAGAAGGPTSLQVANGGVSGTTVAAQGTDTVSPQTYHDVFAGYTFGTQESGPSSRLGAVANRIMRGLSVQIGVRNVFNQVPSFDAIGVSYLYASRYGDLRLRTWWMTLKKAF